MRKSISFLLGAGFSVPMGLPTGEKLGKIIEKECRTKEPTYHGDYICILKEMIDYYMRKNKEFDYEDFYDKIEKYLKNEKIWQSISDKCGIKGKPGVRNFRTYYQYRIYNIFKNILKKGDIRKYDNFIKEIKYLLDNNYEINIHTLNHDLLFESFKTNQLIGLDICDGYDYEGKIYKGKTKDKQLVCLPHFCKKYDKRIRLYKLHGSLDQYRYYVKNNDTDTFIYYGNLKYDNHIKLNGDSDRDTLCKFSEEGEQIDEFEFVSREPDFLTGKKAKENDYKRRYYKYLLAHFSKNLRISKCLIIIGYGGKDKGINQRIIKNLHSPCFIYDKFKNSDLVKLLKEVDNVKNFHKTKIEDFKLPKRINL